MYKERVYSIFRSVGVILPYVEECSTIYGIHHIISDVEYTYTGNMIFHVVCFKGQIKKCDSGGISNSGLLRTTQGLIYYAQ